MCARLLRYLCYIAPLPILILMLISFYTFAEYASALNVFTQFYSATTEFSIICPDESIIKSLKPRRERKCRFCGLDAMQTKFAKHAHAIPELLGNRHLLSDSECDTCNERFSAFENDLASYLGAKRALNRARAKSKIPTFKSQGATVTVQNEEFYGVKDGMAISRKSANDETFTYDRETGTLEIKYFKQPYVPLNVYKALVKIAMSVMPERHLDDYAALLALLLSDDANELAAYATVAIFTVPHSVTKPVCHIFQKANAASKACTHVLMLHFLNYVYEVFIPLHQRDIAITIYSDSEFLLHACPPLFFSMPDEKRFADCQYEWHRFTSSEAIKEEEVVTVNLGPDAFSNTQIYDPVTGKTRESDCALPNIVKILWTDGKELPNFPTAPI